MLEALAEKGVTDRLLLWLHGFLAGRSARVRFQNCLSTPQPHSLVTPQGSCLSPLLFNDLIDKLFSSSYGLGVMLLRYDNDPPGKLLLKGFPLGDHN